jgi:hypothetical protein
MLLCSCALTSPEVAAIRVVIAFDIPPCLERVLVFPVLLYRRLRYGYAFRRITMKRGICAIVDPDDYYRLSRFHWYPQRGRSNVYAYRFEPYLKGRKPRSHAMHRDILHLPPGRICDHINGNGLDNRKANLRQSTYAQNSWNRPKGSIQSSSKYKGVCKHNKDGKWQAQIAVNRTRIYLGRFKTQTEAAKAYDNAAKKYHKEFASLNFP